MKTTIITIVAVATCLTVSQTAAFAAVGCTLNDPDRDIRRIFPEATGFKTEFLTIEENGGKALMKKLETQLGVALDPVYETADVPYAYYVVLKGKETIGHVHGVNQKGKYGGMQLILATDPDGVVRDFYYQKLSSPEASLFRQKAFTDRFKGLTLSDFYKHRDLADGESTIEQIKDPTKRSAADFTATLRGLMKNLILLDEFKFGGKNSSLIKQKNGKEGEATQ